MLKLDENSLVILAGRYLKRDEQGRVVESPEEMFWRVARAVAEAEARFGADTSQLSGWARRFFDLMANLDFLPNTPTLINAGRELGQLAACFVLPLEDSIESIFETLKHAALIHKSGGGTGFNFSRLRPKGDPVRSTGGVASGPVSFMRIFNAATEEIKQGGVRRGANMGILRADHPDIMEFVACKEEEGAFRNFNISVAVPDAFFTALDRSQEWKLVFRDKVYRRLPARELFDWIVQHAHANGEPGLLFVDAVNQANPTPALGLIEATNPCVTGDTWVYTGQGLIRVRDLAQRKWLPPVVADSRVDSNPLVPAVAALATGRKPVFRLLTREGYQLRLTADHQVLTTRGWVAAEKLRPGDGLLVLDRPGGFGREGSYELGLALGWMLTAKKESILVPVGSGGWGGFLETREEGLRIPEEVFTGSKELQRGFLQALFSAWGEVSLSPLAVTLRAPVEELLLEAQRLLLNFGVRSCLCRAGRAAELILTRGAVAAFHREIGLLPGAEAERLERGLIAAQPFPDEEEPALAHFQELVYEGEETVYDLVVPGVHAFVANGLVVHNCGEQPLLPYESCNLGSINLLNMVEGNGLSWEKLREVVHLAVRFLDDVIEVNHFPVPAIAAATRRTRKVGLGVMGWADALFRLGIPYDSEAALALAEEVMSFIRKEARVASRQLAEERGPFPSWEESIYHPELPLRNATLTTIAPTGSISAIAGVSPGIEPVFALVYRRVVLDNRVLLVVDKVFREYLKRNFTPEQGEAIMSAVAQTGNLSSVAAEFGLPETARRLFRTALEITPEWHLRHQAAFQRHTDNAVSKTINLPREIAPAEVAHIFRMAFELRVKGITVYRTGSRREQPLLLPATCRPCHAG
ncbi:ribonucleotide reductase N-terminal alpha domain-containing protein [Desulfothermobacter acidiphilus]|uniref:ribonucleotide reductase N-terminal alpha domain-containing protein n=1 Tax=Desulfothermobacter acidiphilus TaxID=1938353 RepID=UPI003F8C7E8E